MPHANNIRTFDGELCVRLYHRERDHGAMILCETPEKSGHSWYSSLPLNALNFHRNEDTLYLCRPQSRNESMAWAILHFTTMESESLALNYADD